MPTNKNLFRRRGLLLLALAVALGTAGCGPPGPRALLAGKRLIEQGQYAVAVEKLNTATELMATDAQAWNYLGLACHLAGQPDAAATAYQKALRLDHDLVIAHFNLGCLWLEQNQPDKLEGARNELTAFTLHQGNSPLGWVKLGTVELRQRDTAAAEKCFWQALQLNSNNPEALNGLGLVELQYNRHRDAVACFENAIAQQPNYAPALLNLAITAQGYQNERPLALEKYKQYLALTPKPANWDAVNAIAMDLERELVLAARPAADTTATPPRTGPNNYTRPAPVATITRNETATGSTGGAESDSDTAPANPPEVVQVQPQPAVHVAAAPTNPPARTAAATDRASSGDNTVVVSPPVDDAAPGDAPKPGFFQRINPFHREPATVETPGPVAENNPGGTGTGDVTQGAAAPAPRVARYSYVSPAKPAEGNRTQAERYFAQAMESQHDHDLQDAERLYRAATQADPSFFEAQSNLGLAAYGLGDMTQALLAYEIALAIKPDSFNARFNFALALIKANYIIDAAQELERLLAASPNETPEHLAMAHLTLANLYAGQFHRPASARPHYQKVLELDPHNSQATVIRYWLRDHP
jgi:tetratricopeptide (TPR) repeat protein